MDIARKALGALGLSLFGFGLLSANPAAAQSVAASNIAYTYNAKGERISKTVDGVTTRFGYDERGHLISEISPTGTRDYIYLDDMLVSTVDTPAAVAAPSTVSYVTTDHLGTPRAVSDSTGNAIWQNPFQGNAWGDKPVLSNGYTLNVRAVGSYYDPETGLIYNMQRYYDPNTGRFMQSDPIGLAGGINPYVAVNNNPLKYIDPTGTDAILLVNPNTVPINIPGLAGGYAGHAAQIIGSDEMGWHYYSKDGEDYPGHQITTYRSYATLDQFEQEWGSVYLRQRGVSTTPGQDLLMNAYTLRHLNDPFDGYDSNCGDFVKHTMRAGGVNVQGGDGLLPTIPINMTVEFNQGQYTPENSYVNQHWNPDMFGTPPLRSSSR
ncbi:RHS repeat-associated core domain-containing protein [Collimonas silvisoli]|uniref:RHS repeat-associated core domain-containing protein n=1 Tax=Collimonas silvisoli TaxID=2825884 RepID=UPI001B8B8A9D|nr:RHS repeat-associated core domain-containing protein [Collimonas silvisoli]